MKINKELLTKLFRSFQSIGEDEYPLDERSYLSKMPSVEEYIDKVSNFKEDDYELATL